MSFYTTAEIAEMLHVDRHLVGHWRNTGLLSARKLGNNWISTDEELRRFMDLTAGHDIGNLQKCRAVAQTIKKDPHLREVLAGQH